MISTIPIIKKVRAQVACSLFLSILLLPMSANAEQVLSLFVNGQPQPYMTGPLGSHLGVEPVTGKIKREIDGSRLSLGAIQSYVDISSPMAGIYSIELNGSYAENIMIAVRYYDSTNGVDYERTLQALFHGKPLNFSVSFDPDLDKPLIINSPAGSAPKNLTIVEKLGFGQLTWNASENDDDISYRVYARSERSPFYALIGEVQTNTFDTPHAVRLNNSGETWDYIVVAVTNDGRESLYSNAIDNRIRLISNFGVDIRSGSFPLTVSFYDRSSGEPTSWSWDFDNDGVEDSNEENPTFTYNEPGIYDVKLLISGQLGSEQNIRYRYIQVEASVVLVGDLDGDGDVDRNDIAIITALRRTPATGPNDPNDINGDGTINLGDARMLVQLCTRPRCAVD